jgi:very-short-patch-repair endonuclease
MLQKIAPKPKTTFARRLRQNQTSGEKSLWYKLRDRRFHGLKFRRQVPIGPYIVDFFCLEKHLVIEIDGDTHFVPGAKERDDVREKFLIEKGLRVLRFTNAQSVEALDWVLDELKRELKIKEEQQPLT